VKKGLVEIAAKERRGLANMLEILIRDYCKRNGIKIKND
jgi:hypothetical protein